MSQIPLRVLIIEDSEDDTQLLVRRLKKGGFEVSFERVDDPEELRLMMRKASWDLAITDHNMPGFDSGRALEIVKNSDPDIPVIIVSGSIGEELAVSAMKAGANDYIMKSNMARLVPAVTRELREAEIRRDRHRVEQVMHHMAHHDALTGLVNRSEFEQRLRKAIRAARDENLTHALLYLDLDQFKLVNDTCGHAAGDELLRQIAHLLKKPIRGHDTLARVGGDEFSVLLEDCPHEKAMEIADEIRRTVEDFRFTWEKRNFGLGVSIGLVSITPESTSTEELLSAADLACYSAKEQGRNCIQVYHEDEDTLELRRTEMLWVTRLDTAIAEDRFVLYKQRIQALNESSGGAEHCEILLRMLGPDGQIIMPGAFIPAAERYDRMRRVDRWVIKNACEHLGQCFGGKEGIHAINISGASFGDDSLYDFVMEQFETCSIGASHICFEVTETAAITNFHNAINFIKRIRDMGCKFSLDDFGSGLSSFSYLKAMEVDYLKIDGGFVRGIVDNKMDRAIVESINQIGHAAGIKTIAEYVENEAIYDCLCDIGVDFVQGFYIDKPEPLL